MLEFALLGLLKERSMHGYELRKRLREEFGPLSNLSYGSLYPALARLENDGAIRAESVSAPQQRRDPVPFTGSLGGERAATVARRATQAAALALSSRGTRGRKVYEITPRGEALFEQLLETDADSEDPRSFALRLAFARHLTPPARVRLLERRRQEISARLERASRALRQPSRDLDRYERAIAERAETLVASELSWVESLLSEESAELLPEQLAVAASVGTPTERPTVTKEPRTRHTRSAATASTAARPEGRSH